MARFTLMIVDHDAPQTSTRHHFNRSDTELSVSLFHTVMVSHQNVDIEDVLDYVMELPPVEWTEDGTALVMTTDGVLSFFLFVD